MGIAVVRLPGLGGYGGRTDCLLERVDLILSGVAGWWLGGRIYRCGVGRQERRHWIESRFGDRRSFGGDGWPGIVGRLRELASVGRMGLLTFLEIQVFPDGHQLHFQHFIDRRRAILHRRLNHF